MNLKHVKVVVLHQHMIKHVYVIYVILKKHLQNFMFQDQKDQEENVNHAKIIMLKNILIILLMEKNVQIVKVLDL